MNKLELKQKIGEGIYDILEKEADIEVGLAKSMPLQDQYRQDRWYQQRYLTPTLLSECDHFQRLGLNFTPMDVVNILFRCKLAFAVQTEEEYRRRCIGSFVDDWKFIIQWSEKSKGIDIVIDEYLNRMGNFIGEKTLIAEISHFDSYSSDPSDTGPTNFFEELFRKLGFPFVAYFDGDQLIEKHKKAEPGLRAYSLAEAKKYFHSPAIGFTATGTDVYAHLYASGWLRTFLNMLRIAGFIYRPQIDFGRTGIEFMPPITPVFLGRHTYGVWSWNEDAKTPWEKLPDGCLFLSFGYRGLAKMWLDRRAYHGIEKFMLENKVIFDHLKNPWAPENVEGIAPALEILSTATQVPDLGAKILLIYCCLEHLFVPKGTGADNKKYIIGGIHALRPKLIPWFDRLYKVRCEYAHRGYVLKNDEVRSLVFESAANAVTLLIAKLTKNT
jgi:hypothetical protein